MKIIYDFIDCDKRGRIISTNEFEYGYCDNNTGHHLFFRIGEVIERIPVSRIGSIFVEDTRHIIDTVHGAVVAGQRVQTALNRLNELTENHDNILIKVLKGGKMDIKIRSL